MMGERRVDQAALFYTFSLEDHVPANRLLTSIDRCVELEGLRAHLAAVNRAVNSMDQVTQQNAGMVEESTAASLALTRDAAEMTQLVGRFQVSAASERMTGAGVNHDHPAGRLDASGRVGGRPRLAAVGGTVWSAETETE